MTMKNVTVIDEGTIVHEGERYKKVSGDVEAKKGDIIQRKEIISGVANKEHFYKVKDVDYFGDVYVKNDDGNTRGFERYACVVYRKVAKHKTSVIPQASNVVTFEGIDGKYIKVDHKARAGDVVIFRDNTYSGLFNGVSYLVKQGKSSLYVKQNTLLYQPDYGRTQKTVDVYKEVEEEYIPQDGDIVVITDDPAPKLAIGDIGKVAANDGVFRIVVPGKKNSANGQIAKDCRKATPSEVQKYEKAIHKESFSVGDYVKVVKSYAGLEGEIAKIIEIGEYISSTGTLDFLIEYLLKKEGNYGVFAHQVVKATEQEVVEASRPKLKAGDFIKINEGTPSIVAGEVYEVFEGSSGLYIEDDDGDERFATVLGLLVNYEIIKSEEGEKWAKIGRKPDEFKIGDIVRVNSGATGGHSTGTIGELVSGGVLVGKRKFCVLANGIIKDHSHSGFKLVAPVEATFK